MAILIVTSKVAYFPDPEEQEGWSLEKEEGLEYFTTEIGPHKLFWTKCIKDVEKRVEDKHEIIADIVKRIKNKCHASDEDCFYLIVHDLDLLSHHDEGIYPEKNVKIIGSSLVSLIPDRHIYVFQHVPEQDMFKTLVIKNSEEDACITIDDINNTLELINSCLHETPVS